MGDVQLEHGYTRFANSLLEAICRHPLSSRQLRVLLAVARLSYGWNQKKTRIKKESIGDQIAALVDVSPRQARRVVRQLVSMRILISESGPAQPRTLSIRKSFKTWLVPTNGADPQLGLFDGESSPQGPRKVRTRAGPSRGPEKVPRRTRAGPLPIRKTEVKDRKDNVRRAATPPDWSLRISDLMIELLEDVPGSRITIRSRGLWAKAIAKMPKEIPSLRKLEDPEPTIEAGTRWVLGPDNVGQPFEVVVRSGHALLEKWPKIVAAARRHSARAKSPIDEVNEIVRKRREQRGKSPVGD